METGDADTLGQDRLEVFNLLQERLDIGDDRCVGARALRAAGAEPAQPPAERHMRIDGDRDPSGICPTQDRKTSPVTSFENFVAGG
jgi:hypothetical protein